jgi:hypothetical protein
VGEAGQANKGKLRRHYRASLTEVAEFYRKASTTYVIKIAEENQLGCSSHPEHRRTMDHTVCDRRVSAFPAF